MLRAAALALALAGHGVARPVAPKDEEASLPEKAHAENSTVEVPLECPRVGICVAQVSVGSPPQRVRVSIDSGSSVLWVPNASDIAPGFWPNRSTSFQAAKHVSLDPYADGLRVAGTAGREAVALGSAVTSGAPMLVRDSRAPEGAALVFAGKSKEQIIRPIRAEDAFGILGLGCDDAAQDSKKDVDAFFCHFWKQRPELKRTFQLQLGGEAPKLVLGADIQEGPREQGGFRFAKHLFTETALWYVSIRALGLSASRRSDGLFSSDSPPISVDFNSALPPGAAALLDTGAAAIRVSSGLFEMLRMSLGSGCQRSGESASIICPCEDVSDLATITLSFESSGNARFLGLDAGADFLACVPPAAYATRDPASGVCNAAIVDGGEHHSVFGVTGIVLGVPFFRSATVAYDVDRHEVAIGPLTPTSASAEGPPCECADPKNWWNTGKRLSARRVALCLSFVCAYSLYIFVVYSPSSAADSIRLRLGGFASAASDRIISVRGNRLGTGAAGGARRVNRNNVHRAAESTQMLADPSSFVALHSDVES